MKKLFTLISLAVLAVLSVNAKVYEVEDIPNVHVYDVTRYVTNPDGVLSYETVERMDSTIANLWEETSAELVVVAVDSISDSYEVNEFATALFGHWGIGKKDKDNGVLVLLVKGIHRVVIRTGYGVEGVLPDIICGRVIREEMIPHFKKDDYDSGIIAGIDRLKYIMTTPGATEELMSEIESEMGLWDRMGIVGKIYFSFNIFFLPIFLILFLSFFVKLNKMKGSDPYEKAKILRGKKKQFVGLTLMTLGLGLPFLLYYMYIYKKYRNAKKRCSKCNIEMTRIPAESKNQYLNQNQLIEERIKAVEYDVWKCPRCNKVDIVSFETGKYKECPACHSIALGIKSRRTIRSATSRRSGEGVATYICKCCGHTHEERYTIQREHNSSRGGGSSRSGGSFGGGRTGGGGASGGW